MFYLPQYHKLHALQPSLFLYTRGKLIVQPFRSGLYEFRLLLQPNTHTYKKASCTLPVYTNLMNVHI